MSIVMTCWLPREPLLHTYSCIHQCHVFFSSKQWINNAVVSHMKFEEIMPSYLLFFSSSMQNCTRWIIWIMIIHVISKRKQSNIFANSICDYLQTWRDFFISTVAMFIFAEFLFVLHFLAKEKKKLNSIRNISFSFNFGKKIAYGGNGNHLMRKANNIMFEKTFKTFILYI